MADFATLGFTGVSKAQTVTRLIAALAIENTYLKGLTTYPQVLQQVTGVGYAIAAPGQYAPPTTYGKGYKYFVPQAVSFATTMLLPLVLSVANSVVASVDGLVFAAPFVHSAANGYQSGIIFPYFEVALELVAVETSPDYIYAYNDMVVDSRLVTTGIAAVLDVAPPIAISDNSTVGVQGIGRLKAYRFYNPMQKSTAVDNIWQLRASYPGLAITSTTAPAATICAHVSGIGIVKPH